MKHNKADAILLSIFLVLICVVIASAQDLEWKTIRPGGEEFTVEMPGLPTRVGWIIPIEKDIKLAPNVYDLVVNNVRYQIMSFSHTSPVSMPQDFNLFVGRLGSMKNPRARMKVRAGNPTLSLASFQMRKQMRAAAAQRASASSLMPSKGRRK